MTADAAAREQRVGIDFAPVKDMATVAKESAAAPLTGARDTMLQQQIPPVIRSVLEYAHYLMIGHSQWLRATPGYQGGLFYKGRPYCFSGGYRDSSRPRDMDDKSNHLRIKDALNYGTLGVPIAAAYLCELHGQGVFDLTRPLVAYLPELQHKLGDDVTGRSILSYTTVLHDGQVLRDAAARALRPHFAGNVCDATQVHVYQPIQRFFAPPVATTASAATTTTTTTTAKTTTTVTSGQQQRANLVYYVQNAPRAVIHRVRHASHARPSHFSVALLIAAVERALRGRSFEQAIHDDFFQRAECHGSNYGAPRPWRNPRDLFYRPTGQARQHVAFGRPLPTDDERNCGPAVLSASLNLYAPPEEFAKLLLLSVDAIVKARRLLPPPPPQRDATTEGRTTTHYDFGVLHRPAQHLILLQNSYRRSIDFVPGAAAFRYDTEHDVGCFGVANCGTRNARTFANNLERLIYTLFRKYALRTKAKIDEPIDIDNMELTQTTDEQNNPIDNTLHKVKMTEYFRRHNAHKNT